MKTITPAQNLKQARSEIEAILKRRNIAGFVTLHGAPDRGEVFWNIWPSYSVLKGDFPMVRIVSRAADYGGNVVKQTEDRAATANMMNHLATSMAGCGLQFLELSQVVDAKLGAEHDEGRFEPGPSKMNPDTH